MAESDCSRIVILCVGGKESTDTTVLWRYALAHVLEPKGDKVVLVHVRTAAPSGWEPLRMALSVHGDEAGWLPEEMRLALKSFVSEYWELKGSSVAEAIAEFLTHIPNARLLLVGCRGQEGLSRMMSGSTSKAIVSACASVATLIVRAPIFVSEQPPFRVATRAGMALEEDSAAAKEAGRSFMPHSSRTIAFAMDGSDASGVLLGYALHSFLRPEDHIVILHAQAGDEFNELTASGQLAACSAELHNFLSDERRLRVIRIASSDVKGSLVEALETEGPFACVIVGSRGLSPMRRLAERVQGKSGSVSLHLLDHAPCPVMVIGKAALMNWLSSDLTESPDTPIAKAKLRRQDEAAEEVEGGKRKMGGEQ